jgi:3-methyladenine DNA glycosylase AlkD
MMGHDNLANHFKTNFGMVQHHKWSLSDLENMMPWERYVYVDMLHEHIKEEEQRIIDLQNERKTQYSTLNRKIM